MRGGEDSGTSKLTAEQVRAIRKFDEAAIASAKLYNVDPSNIGHIRAGQIWNWLR